MEGHKHQKFQTIEQLQEQKCAWAHLTEGLKLARVNRKFFLRMNFAVRARVFQVKVCSCGQKKARVATA